MSESNGQPDLHIFDTGAVRNKDGSKERYDLFSPIATEALARVFAEGADEYPPWNWENGMSISFLVNRGLRHWRLYASGDRSEDHLAKAEWAFHAAKHSEVMWPHLNQDMRRMVDGQGCIPPTVDDETAASWGRFRENMAKMKRDLKEAAKEPVPAAPDIREGDHVTLDDGGFRVVRPSRKLPRRFYLVSSRDDPSRLRMAQYRGDIQWEGHEVVSRWIDQPGLADEADCLDLQSCDAVVIFVHPDIDVEERVVTAKSFHKESIVVGECRYVFENRWFPDWEEFLRSLAPAREESASAR